MGITTEYLDSLLQKDEAKGLFRCKREMFTSQELFELEMEHIFEGNWIYLAHESQLPKINDYYTTKIGRQPVVITRNKDNQLNCFINSCAHRGATLARFKHGNKSSFTCPFHGWTFNNSGKLLKIKDPVDTGYPDSFNCEGSHDLKKIARFESYRGFLFGSLNPDVQSLEDFLGESKVIIDMIVTPKVMAHAMGLNPAILLLSLSVWGALLGFFGLIIALPLTTLLMAYYQRYVTREEETLADPPDKTN